MKKIRIGVLGGYRGTSMINFCRRADNAEVVAVCDNNPEVLETQRALTAGMDIAFYDNFDAFIKHDMDAVVLANYAHEHAPFAIRAMREGKHVFSEVLPVQTMKESVELIETVEETGMVYAYGENYCYMPAPYEMRRLYRENKIGEFEYGECEYIHNCEPIWHAITYGEKDHWRNNMYSTFYCTHSIGPIIHATGLRPVSVIGMETSKIERTVRTGLRGSGLGIEMITLENGGIVKSMHGGLYTDSIWYNMYGSKGSMESAREIADNGMVLRLTVKADTAPGAYRFLPTESYLPKRALDDKTDGFGHGGSDFYCINHFIEKLRGDPDADIIDVYEAMDMFLPGLFAYRSILAGNVPMEIPNLRDPAERDKWRNDTACTDPKVAGDQLLPCYSKGNLDIDDAVYQLMKDKWEEEKKKTENTYRDNAFHQSSKK